MHKMEHTLSAGARCMCFLGAQPLGIVSIIPQTRFKVRKWEWSGPPLTSICSKQMWKWCHWTWVDHKRSNALGSQRTFLWGKLFIVYLHLIDLFSPWERGWEWAEKVVLRLAVYLVEMSLLIPASPLAPPPPGYRICCSRAGIVVCFTESPVLRTGPGTWHTFGKYLLNQSVKILHICWIFFYLLKMVLYSPRKNKYFFFFLTPVSQIL